MGRRGNSSSTNSHRRRPKTTHRLIAAAFIEQQERLLLTQLATGRFAGFWLLPSTSVEEETVDAAVRRLVPERTGRPVVRHELMSVVEEPHLHVHALRFIFAVEAGEPGREIADPEIARTRWFSRESAREVLRERDVVPALGVMTLLRAWMDDVPLPRHQVLREDVPCPCGSGFQYPGCCGWDMR